MNLQKIFKETYGKAWFRGALLISVSLFLLILMGGYLFLGGREVQGVVLDEDAREPIPGAEVRIGGRTQLTDEEGRYRLQGLRGNLPFSVRADGYSETGGQLDLRPPFPREFQVEVVLRPNTFVGRLLAQDTGEPVGGAKVSLEGQSIYSQADGTFSLRHLVGGTGLLIEVGGYEPAELTFEGQEVADIYLQPVIAEVEVHDEEGQALEATVSWEGQVAKKVEEGRYALRTLVEGAVISVQAEGYKPTQVVYEGHSPISIALERYHLVVVVADLYSSLPISGARVKWGQAVTETDGEGKSAFTAQEEGALLVQAQGYESREVAYQGQESVQVALRPDTLSGVITDAGDGSAIAKARVIVGGHVVVSAADGRYQVDGVPAAAKILIRAPGYKGLSLEIPRSTTLNAALEPFQAKGLYINIGILAHEDRVRELIDLVDRSQLNTIVVDVKGDSGMLVFPSRNALAREMGAIIWGWMDLKELIRLCQERGIYTIARQVVFKDAVLATHRPELAVKYPDGTPFTDNLGTPWVDPFSPEVWDYNVAIAKEIAALGFDEIQVDYIRFPTDGDVGNLVYSQPSTSESRLEAIGGFMTSLQEGLLPSGVFLSADVFGLTPWVNRETGIGQMIENVAPYVDYLSPMLYPSLFNEGVTHSEVKEPALHPYDVVYRSIIHAKERTSTLIRPWLQHYSLFGVEYGLEQYLAQKKAAEDAASWGWLFWNSRGIYDEAAFAE